VNLIASSGVTTTQGPAFSRILGPICVWVKEAVEQQKEV